MRRLWLWMALKSFFAGGWAEVRRVRAASKSQRSPEHPILLRRQRFIYSTKANFLVAGSVLWLGVWAEFWGAELKAAIVSAWAGWGGLSEPGGVAALLARGVDVHGAFFGIVFLGVTLALAYRLKVEDDEEDEKTLEVFRAITRAPNVRVHEVYEEYWRAFVDELQPLVSLDTSRTETKEMSRPEAAKAIRGALRVIAEMAAHFSRVETKSESYGANVMIVVRKRDDGGPLFVASLVEALKFHARTDLDSLQGMLYLPAALLVPSLGDPETRAIPNIALPIPIPTGPTANVVIPGAPMAILRGGSIHNDARLIATEECQAFAQWIRDEIAFYFSDEGAGRHVGSFASFRLGSGEDPIGVLNIDTSHQHVLGVHPEFHRTFVALLVPMLWMLRDAVRKYARDLDVGELAAEQAGSTNPVGNRDLLASGTDPDQECGKPEGGPQSVSTAVGSASSSWQAPPRTPVETDVSPVAPELRHQGQNGMIKEGNGAAHGSEDREHD